MMMALTSIYISTDVVTVGASSIPGMSGIEKTRSMGCRRAASFSFSDLHLSNSS
jgi:hypothetical protein